MKGNINLTSIQKISFISINGYSKITITHIYVNSLINKEWTSILSKCNPTIECNLLEKRINFHNIDKDAIQPVFPMNIEIDISQNHHQLSFELFFEREPEEEISIMIFYDLKSE